MAWMLLRCLLSTIDWYGLSLSAAKSAGGALGGFLLKVMWRRVMSVFNKGMNEAGTMCLIPNCGKPAAVAMKRRGLCLQCYGRAKSKVDAGDTTWEKLAEMGLCLSDKDPFDDAYSKAMDDRTIVEDV